MQASSFHGPSNLRRREPSVSRYRDIFVLNEHHDCASLTPELLATTGVAQGAFVGHLIHELRNLLAPMGNAVQLIRMRAAEDARLLPVTAMLDRQIGSLTKMLEKLAAADHLLRSDTTLACVPVDLRGVVTDAVEASRAAIERGSRHLYLNLPTTAMAVVGSAPHLTVVVRDLLDNAIRFTRDDGHLWIELDTADNGVRLRVRDDGRGILPVRLAQLFTPRFSSHVPGPEARDGLGLSLATAARVMALHGGRIEARSAGPGAGSEFTLWLPKHPAEAWATNAPRNNLPASVTLRPRRVLVVDDNDAMQDSLTQMLEELGQEVRSARDGEEALSVATEWEPDLLLLDINLPKLNGYRVAQALRKQFTPAGMSIVMMTGADLIDTVRRGAMAVGADRCIDKLQAGALLRELLGKGRS